MAKPPANRSKQRRVKPEDIFGASADSTPDSVHDQLPTGTENTPRKAAADRTAQAPATPPPSPPSSKPRPRPAPGANAGPRLVLRDVAEVTPLPPETETPPETSSHPAPNHSATNRPHAPATIPETVPAPDEDLVAPAPPTQRTRPQARSQPAPADEASKPRSQSKRKTVTDSRPKPRLVHENDGLRVDDVGKSFKRRSVLRGVSLTVQRGEVVGLLGPNGAGKTTCFYIVTGLISPDQGTITLDGNDITNLPMYRRSRLGVGYLPQEASIFRGLTVEANIMAVLEVVEKSARKRARILDELLEEFSITHLRRSPAVALSGGERRRCEIARALASHPNFILLDEPFAGIDPIAVGDIRELVSHLKDRGIGVLITDHNVRETLDIVDRAYILHDGVVLMEGGPEDVIANEQVRRVYLGDSFSL